MKVCHFTVTARADLLLVMWHVHYDIKNLKQNLNLSCKKITGCKWIRSEWWIGNIISPFHHKMLALICQYFSTCWGKISQMWQLQWKSEYVCVRIVKIFNEWKYLKEEDDSSNEGGVCVCVCMCLPMCFCSNKQKELTTKKLNLKISIMKGHWLCTED